MEFGLRISFLDLSRSSLVSWQILGEHFIFRGLAVCQPFQPASVCSTATTFLAPAGANSAGPIDSYAGSPLDFQFFSGNLNKRRPTKKGASKLICSPRHYAADNRPLVLGCYLPEFVALPVNCPLALGMLK
jgi:hypothetical protein